MYSTTLDFISSTAYDRRSSSSSVSLHLSSRVLSWRYVSTYFFSKALIFNERPSEERNIDISIYVLFSYKPISAFSFSLGKFLCKTATSSIFSWTLSEILMLSCLHCCWRRLIVSIFLSNSACFSFKYFKVFT